MTITINLPPEPDDDTDMAHLRRAAAKAALPDELQSVSFGKQGRVRASDLARYIESLA